MLHIYRQITGLRQWRPVVICQKREEEKRFPFDAVIRIPKPMTHPLRRFWVKQVCSRPVTIYRSEARRLSAVIRAVHGRVLHVYFGHIAVHLLPLLRKPPVPVVVSFHGADAMVDMNKPAYLDATEEMLGLARLVLVRSESLAERIVALGCPREKVRIHRTGIPLDRFHFVRRHPPEDGAWRFFQACRLIAKKGLHTSLRAFAKFAQTFPRSQFTIAGDGPLLDELASLAGQLGVGDRVIFTGFLSQPALREQLYSSHIFLHPSELGPDGNQEGVPNSMLEAMSTGTPVVATFHGGIPEAVDNGLSGILIREGDSEGMAKAMVEIVSNSKRYSEMGVAAAAAVAARFEQQNQVKVLEACYAEASGLRFEEQPR